MLFVLVLNLMAAVIHLVNAGYEGKIKTFVITDNGESGLLKTREIKEIPD